MLKKMMTATELLNFSVMLITLLSVPSAVEWRASQSVVLGARPLNLFDLPEKNGKSGGASSLSCVPFT